MSNATVFILLLDAFTETLTKIPLTSRIESLSNVTAQTCAGAPVAPRWVLTAAACVDVLPLLHGEQNFDSKQGSFRRYTIIANASNPLVDGTVHDVSEIILKHTSQSDAKKGQLTTTDTIEHPGVALMKTNTWIGVSPLPLMKREVVDDVVTVFGWHLLKNVTGHFAMTPASFSAHRTDPAECKADTRILLSDIFCFSASNRSDPRLNQISSGGPVVTTYEGKIHIVAVVQSIHNFLITAFPVNKYNELDNIIYNN